MTSEYFEPDKKQDENQPKKEPNESLTDQHKDTSGKSKKPGKKESFKVLHEDGSFADLPDQGVQSSGALEGSVGVGQ
jgi:hypothetical protein